MELLTLHGDILTKIFITVHSSGELNEVVLFIVEFLSLHDDVLSKVLVSVHAGGELGQLFALVVVEFLTLHDDILTKVLVSVHTSGEEALDSWNLGSVTGTCLKETSSGWDSFVV